MSELHEDAAPAVRARDNECEPAPAVTLADFQKVDLRVATVLEATAHRNADKLIVMKIRLGERTKQIVAGLRPFMEPETLVGRQIVVADNLEPAVLRGERSEGMLLAVTDGDDLALVVPDRKVHDGSRVS